MLGKAAEDWSLLVLHLEVEFLLVLLVLAWPELMLLVLV